MQVTKCLIIAVLVLVAPTAWATEEKLSNTRDASCIVKITVDPSIMPLNGQTLDYLQHLLGSSMARQAARDVLGLEGDAVGPALQNTHFDWLEESMHRSAQPAVPGASRGRSRGGRRSSSQTEDQRYNAMMNELAQIYGDRYTPRAQAVDANAPKYTNRTEPRGMMMDGMGPGAMGGTMGGGGMSGRGMMSRGMGGMGGGMMGGMGDMMGLMDVRPAPATAVTHTVMLKLSVKLPEQVKPAAREFLKALVQNLKKTLWAAYEQQATELKEATNFAESQREEAAATLDMAMGIRSPERVWIDEQLDMIVDLSILTPEMPVAEAFNHIKNAVEPPLPLVVMWKELLDCCEIEPMTPIDIDGVPQAKLSTALKLVIEAVSGGIDITYQVDDDVVIVREEELQTAPPAPATTSTVDVQGLALRRRELSRQLERLEMDLATRAARERAIQEQIARIRAETQERLASDAVTQEMEKLVKVSSDHLEYLLRVYEAGTKGSEELNGARANLARAKIELARRREELSKTVGGARLVELNKDLSTMAIDEAEMVAQLQIVRQQLDNTEQQWRQASRFDPKAARIQVAKEALDIADRNVLTLKKRLANLQPPTVTMVGSD